MSSKHYTSLFSRSRTGRSRPKTPKAILKGHGPRLPSSPTRINAPSSTHTPLTAISATPNTPQRQSLPSPPTPARTTGGNNQENSQPATLRTHPREDEEEPDDEEEHDDEDKDGGRDPKRRRKHHVKDTVLCMAADLAARKVSDALEAWHTAARGTARQVTMFPQANAAFAHGLDVDNPDEHSETEDDDHSQDDIEEYKYQCTQYLKLMPHMKDDLDYLLSDPSALLIYGKYISARASAARGDDIGNLSNKYIMRYIARVPQVANWPGGVPHDVPKTGRGWMSTLFGLLLCPQDLLPQYMLDMKKFCLDVRNGIQVVTADDFPMFLYDQSLVKEDDPLAGLFRGPLLLLIVKSMYTGPTSAISGIEERSSGRAPWVATYKTTRMEPRLIVYAAVVARYVMCSQASWSRRDIDFLLPVFYQRLLKAFEIASFSKEILAWYDLQVFGTARTQDGAPDTQPRENSLAAKIAARVAAEASQTQSE